MNTMVWVFNGGSPFPSGIFSSREKAEDWILKNRLSGTLTAYPVDIGTYDWAIQIGIFTPKQEKHTSPEFIQRFSSASQEHDHYEDGKCRTCGYVEETPDEPPET
jgi:hypothetical protein